MPAATAQRPFPLPADFARTKPRDYLFRAATAAVVARLDGTTPDEIIRSAWPDDRVSRLVTRAATLPATIGTANWAGALATSAVSDAIVGLAPASAGAELIRRGLRVSLDGVGSITVPRRLMLAADAGSFVAEGSPLQVRSLNVTGGPTLTPFKFGVIVPFTNELARRAVQSFELIVKQMLSEASALALDAALFSNTAGSSIRPPGILNGITALTATAGGGQNAVSKDIGNLVAALATGGAGVDVVFVASPAQAAALKIWAGPKFDYPVLASAALAAGSVVAVEAGGFVSAFGPEPRFDTSDASVIHEEDTTPLAIGTAGSPNTVAAPARSLFQTDATALRMILPCSWGLRAAGHVAWVTGATW